MEKYLKYGIIGEGSYGIVVKCKSRETGKFVAVKEIFEGNDENVKKLVAREIKILKNLRHRNLVLLLEVIRQKQSLFLVFEYMDFSMLEVLQKNSHGLTVGTCRNYMHQILNGLDFCHRKHILHRDIKPENVLVSSSGLVKLCDFGFARLLSSASKFTEYVATRWYRAPELLVGNSAYGKIQGKSQISATAEYQKICKTTQSSRLKAAGSRARKLPSLKIAINNLTFAYQKIDKKEITSLLTQVMPHERNRGSLPKTKGVVVEKALNIILPSVQKGVELSCSTMLIRSFS